MSRPIVLDIDGTMSRPDRSIEGRVMDAVRAWEGPVVLATGKSFPYPVALCDFIGIEMRVIAENGGVVCTDDEVLTNGDGEAARRVAHDLVDAGYDLGWGDADLINRWRETEVAVGRDVPREIVDEVASSHGLEVVDSGYAYHVKDPTVNKGLGLETIADLLSFDPGKFAAVGDSENDVETFAVAGVSYAVANGDDRAVEAADVVTEGTYADGLLEAMDSIADER